MKPPGLAPRHRGLALLAVLVVSLAVAAPAAAGDRPPVFRLLSGTGELEAPSESADSGSPAAPALEEPRPRLLLGGLLGGLSVAGSAAVALQNGPYRSFHVTYEGFFGRHTYAGGADKAAHFVDSSIASKELGKLYEKLGFTETQSRWLGFGVAALGGLAIELGDGVTAYGFSPEDLLMDVLGSGSSALIAALGAEDLVGFRYGFLVPNNKDTCCPVHGLGHDYSNEIYTADLKVAGVAGRLNLNVGPFKYLLLSLTYGSKGYPRGLPEDRERLVGIEIGLNIPQILDDVGIRRDAWWGYALHFFFDNVRVPFTAVGFRYDLNSGTWRGPTTN